MLVVNSTYILLRCRRKYFELFIPSYQLAARLSSTFTVVDVHTILAILR